MKSQFLVFVQLALALAMAYSCFCRLWKTDKDTCREVRWAFVFEGLCAGLVACAPFLPVLMPHEMQWQAGTTPTGVWLTFALSVWLVQLVDARYWHAGCPAAFQRTTEPSSSPFAGWLAAPLLLMAAVFLAAPQAAAESAAEDGKWRPVDGDMVYLPQGGEVRCTNEAGCVTFTAEALRAVLQKAGGTCGRIPKDT